MLTPGWALALALSVGALAPAEAHASAPRSVKKTKKKKRRDRLEDGLRWRPFDGWTLVLPLDASGWAGYLDGLGLRPEAGAVVGFEARARPSLRQRAGLHLDGEARYTHREGIDAALTERRLRVELAASYPVAEETRLGARGLVQRVDRPGWIDLYQPEVDEAGAAASGWQTTDRYGQVATGGALTLDHAFAPRLALAVDLGARDTVSMEEPAFDPVLAPTHLTPGDRRRWAGGIKLTGRTPERTWRHTTALRVAHTGWRYQFARDAGSGLTHAGPGGEAANPLFETVSGRLRHRSSVWLKRWKTRVASSAGYTRVEDLFEGYYTSDGLELGLSARVRPLQGLVVSAGTEVTWRWYGRDGYQAGPNHPPLDSGETRRSRRVEADARVAYQIWRRRLTVFAEGAMVWRDTNFPDYVPGVFPVGGALSVDWDRDTWRSRLGLALSLDP